MDEFNDVQQEQCFDFGEKKNTARKTIKRILLVIGVTLAVYMVYSIVHLFLSTELFPILDRSGRLNDKCSVFRD